MSLWSSVYHSAYPLPTAALPLGKAGSYRSDTASGTGGPGTPDATTSTPGAPGQARPPQAPRRRPHSLAASKSRSQCDQQSCRHRTGYQLEALERSVPKMPDNRSPPAHGPPDHRVTSRLKAPSQSLSPPPITRPASPVAPARLVEVHQGLLVHRGPGFLHGRREHLGRGLFQLAERAYTPWHTQHLVQLPPWPAPAGQGARGTSPQAERHTRCHCYSVTTGCSGGSSLRGLRFGRGPFPHLVREGRRYFHGDRVCHTQTGSQAVSLHYLNGYLIS